MLSRTVYLVYELGMLCITNGDDVVLSFCNFPNSILSQAFWMRSAKNISNEVFHLGNWCVSMTDALTPFEMLFVNQIRLNHFLNWIAAEFFHMIFQPQ